MEYISKNSSSRRGKPVSYSSQQHARLSRAMAEQCIIEQRWNPLIGNTEWVVIKARGTEEEAERARGGGGGSLAHTQYLDMLNDSPRNRAFDEAIRKVVKAGDHVLDIGAGTGLLSLMAWRASNAATVATDREEFHCGSSAIDPNDGDDDAGNRSVTTGRVTACESYLPMVKLARKVLRASRVGHGVRLIHKRSDELQMGIDMPGPADVLVSEILDSELLGEGLIPTLRHAHAHLLKPNAKSVPYRATIFGQLIECSYLWRCNDLAGVEEDIGDGLILAPMVVDGRERGSSGTLHIDALADQLTLISEPFEVFAFEFSKAPADRRVCKLEIPASRAGNVHALVSWWVLELDEDGEITYSTAPGWIEKSTWRDHWKQCIWYFSGSGVKVSPGDLLSVDAVHDEISIQYVIRSSSELRRPESGEREDGPAKRRVDSSYRSHLLTRPERISVLGDKSYRRVIKDAIMKAMQATPSPVCVIVDDSVLSALAAALVQPNAHVVAMLPGLQHSHSTLMKSISEANGLESDQIKVVDKKAAQLRAEDLSGRKVEVLIAEPYYRGYEDLVPWRHLRFWHERTSLAPLLVEHPTIIPCEGVLRGVAVFLPDLWNNQKVLASVEGFDHSAVNQVLGASALDGPLLPRSLWQCGQYKELTDPFSIMTFDFSLSLRAVEGSVTVPVCSSGLCHGIALWMDWVMESENKTVLSTGPTGGEPNCHRQGIKLLASPIRLLQSSPSEEISISGNSSNAQNGYSELTVSAIFDPSTGDIAVSVSTI